MKGISNLLIFRLVKPPNPSYALKKQPERKKYSGILNALKKHLASIMLFGKYKLELLRCTYIKVTHS